MTITDILVFTDVPDLKALFRVITIELFIDVSRENLNDYFVIVIIVCA